MLTQWLITTRRDLIARENVRQQTLLPKQYPFIDVLWKSEDDMRSAVCDTMTLMNFVSEKELC